LAVAGENGHDLTKRSQSVIATSTFPNAQACLAPGVGHASNGENAELFSAVIRSRVTGASLPDELIPV
jgi:hypothetical protein